MIEWGTLWQVAAVVAALFAMGGLFVLVVGGISPQGYTPMSPDEEREWLREVSSLTDEEIEEMIDGPPVF